MNRTRPDLLKALCILTFLGSTLAFFAYFMAALFFDKTSELIVKYSSWHTTDKISPLYFAVFMVLYAISLAGAIRMWKLHRDGFWLYVFAQAIAVFLPAVWINWQAFSTTNAVFTTVFIMGYLVNLKILK